MRQQGRIRGIFWGKYGRIRGIFFIKGELEERLYINICFSDKGLLGVIPASFKNASALFL